MDYPKRLIEVDLPIKRISVNARIEKSIRHGHISTLNIWWARRPLTVCRAVLCAALWPDPADPSCPQIFIDEAKKQMLRWSQKNLLLLSPESISTYIKYQKNPVLLENRLELRIALLTFIADYANWNNSNVEEFLTTGKKLTNASHLGMGGLVGTKPLVVDPFAGGGSIPVESLRLGANSFASDLNPLAVTLNRVVLEYIPRHHELLSNEIRKWGNWIKTQANLELSKYFPSEQDGSNPIAYIWARTIQCEGPNCGSEIPLIRSLWLAKKSKRQIAMMLVPQRDKKTIGIEIIERDKGKWISKNNSKLQITNPQFSGTTKRGSVTCPCCGFTTSVNSVRKQLSKKKGGTNDSKLLVKICVNSSKTGRTYKKPNDKDYSAFDGIEKKILELKDYIPDDELPFMSGVFNVPLYGIDRWEHLFTKRQKLTIATFSKFINQVYDKIDDKSLAKGISICLSFCLSKIIDRNSSLCTWQNTAEKIGHTFGRQALGMVWDFVECNSLSNSTGSWDGALNLIIKVIEFNAAALSEQGEATVIQHDAKTLDLPDNIASILFTDPPYYNAVPYADLSDFFLVWLSRCLKNIPDVNLDSRSPKDEELCEMVGWDPVRYPNKDSQYFESGMKVALSNAKRFINDEGIGIIVFAHKSTKGWESFLNGVIEAGWVVTSSWPIDTEFEGRLRAMGSASLVSSIHLICRPRTKQNVGDWRDILNQLPKRIHEWMPRLAQEGVVGADAIFACLGPALEIYSRYSTVEKASGEKVLLKEYLEHVWAAVAKEALNMIFEDADATGFEEDSRLTAMWLWTLFADKSSNGKEQTKEDDVESDEESEDDTTSKKKKVKGYVLEYDAARKIAQGLGIHLENLNSVAEIRGDKATLLSVGERAKYLFAKEDITIQTRKSKKKAQEAFDFMKEIEKEESDVAIVNELARMNTADTTLDKLHQTMLLFVANRSEAMKRLLVDEGFGRDNNFWKLAQALSALYPAGSDEKRWVDGVLARKKGLGF